ncbi:hypothetical protein EUTSA_v10009467mg [Eutrema salsugineum]|uniref:HMA domain-containing protein n=1 Tax=Eutrema salsugineum TaxID=72664 RepID=V4MQL6_EUTSA|nr:heavy metal-associated isoprenylated plant protein 4 [Eutrema salsugineum]ESQ33976.1 hypothetical protein EUTSA_v10009467mg [Eutrema salsugineum]
MGEKEEKKEKGEEIITAVYKVHLHCRKCACDIKKPLLRFQGVHGVEFDLEKNEIKVKGKIEVVKIHKQIEKWSKKKVELISPKPSEVKKTTTTTTTTTVAEKKTTEVKKDAIRTTILKVHIHCAKCDKDLQNKLLKHKAIHIVKTDSKAQTLTVQGTIESAKLLTYIRKKVHKHAEIISSKTDEEKKKEEEEKKKKEEEKKKKEEEEKKKKEEVKVEVTKTITETVELKEKIKVEGQKDKDGNIPYFVHYVYAPQLFSDENPNACCIV